ncbi:MAG TPA: choice-of-anchor A family protein [Myxococcaceae bacterium]|nr:choice-of-anchor A family protein [Myxococcaceae bacterium]
MKKQMMACSLVALLWAVPSAAGQKTWTLDGEFDTGVLDSVNHDAPNNHQLQLNTSSSTEPYIWIANYAQDTVTKMDTRTGKQVAKYHSALVRNWDGSVPTVAPIGGGCNSPSRTAVDGSGNAFAVNRGVCPSNSASVTKYAGSLSACVDRNGNGVIETSSDVNGNGLIEMNATEFKGQADECILYTKNFAAPGDLGRGAAVDADQNLWVSGYGSSKLWKLNGATGALLQVIDARSQSHLPSYIYGIAIGPNGFIYTSDINNRYLMKINPNAPVGSQVVRTLLSPKPTYGLAVDKDGVAWLGLWDNSGGNIVRADFTAGTVTLHGAGQGACNGLTRGVAVDQNGDVWTSCFSTNRLLKFNSAGVLLGSWAVGSGPVGAAVDGDRKIWTVNQSGDTATRFDPVTNTTQSFPTGGSPYSYSDMTGFQQRNFTQRQGDWTAVHDSGIEDAIWGAVLWNREPQGSVPAGTSITVEARTANTQAALANTAWVPVANGAAPGLADGRFIEVRTTLRIQTGTVSPVLSDVTVSFTAPTTCFDVNLSDYNLFVLQDYNLGADILGKAAAGGNITMSNFSVGVGLPAADTANVLVAGGNLNLANGAVWGDAVYGGAFNADTSVSFPRGAASQGTPIDFVARGNELRQLSARLAARPANGTTTVESWGGVFFTGTDPAVNVFQVNASDLASAWTLFFNAPAGSLVVVNVAGTAGTLRGGHVFNGGIDQTGVLFNFANATTFNADGYGLWGTLLAPYADVTFNNGSFDGGIYAKSMTGNAEGHINALINRTICE